MNILIVAFETGRWGPARLVQPLHAAGFAVAALCPGDNPVAQTDFLDRHFPLTDTRSSRHVARRLVAAIAAWQPQLVIPADERTVACLQALLRRPGTAGLTAAARALLTRSLGNPARFDAMLLKSATLALARTHGVRVPPGVTVASADAAAAQAAELGFPLYLKTSFSWAGQGVTLCADAPALSAALDAAMPRRSRLRSWLRRRLHRDWYPTDSAIDLQRPVAGVPAMYCAVALEGRLLAGFAATALQTVSATGPSSRVRLAAHAEMARVAEKMVAALGASGFIGFDFMHDTATGEVLLLECNPRPIQVCHLGPRIGVDLCAALATALAGQQHSAPEPSGEATVALFPQSWHGGTLPTEAAPGASDIPWNDPSLIAAMARAHPTAGTTMRTAIQAKSNC